MRLKTWFCPFRAANLHLYSKHSLFFCIASLPSRRFNDYSYNILRWYHKPWCVRQVSLPQSSELLFIYLFIYLLRKKASSYRSSPLSVCLGFAVQKKLQTPCAQMTKLSKGGSSARICFPVVSPVVWLFASLFRFLHFPLSQSWGVRGKVPLTTSSVLKA